MSWKQREYIAEEDASSPTVSTEAVLLTCVIDAKEGRDVATADVPGAFLHCDMDEEVYVVVDGTMVNILIRSNKKYAKYIHITKSGKKLIYLKLDKAMYGTLRAARIFWEHLTKLLKENGFKANAYDTCVMNKIIDGQQCTVVWHVDDLKISHVSAAVVDEVIKFLEAEYGDLSITRGNQHTYVGMDLTFNNDKTVTVGMTGYLEEALEDWGNDFDTRVVSPAAVHLFEVDENCEKLPEVKRELLHRIVAKLLFVSTRARPDIHLAISYLTSRCSKADYNDWKKLRRLMTYIKNTINLSLTLGAHDLNITKWWIDAAYGVRDGYKSQTGGTMSMGQGCLMPKAVKQKINTKSSTEAELVGVSDLLPYMIWTSYFLQAQGYDIDTATLYQDNKSAILLEKNGRKSSGKNTKHVNIRYFFIKDRVDAGEINIEHCPTALMIADYFTKPLQGNLFRFFRDQILGLTSINLPDHPSGAYWNTITGSDDPDPAERDQDI
jgi:hypothetical protein